MVRDNSAANSTTSSLVQMFSLTDCWQIYDDSEPEGPMNEEAHAVLKNLNNACYESATFILPSPLPEDRLTSYHAVLDSTSNFYRVSKARRVAGTKPMAPIMLSYHTNIARGTPHTIPTAKAPSSTSALADSVHEKQTPNIQTADTLPLSMEPRQVELSASDSISLTGSTSSMHPIPERQNTVIVTRPAQPSVLADSNNSIYVSPTGKDWILIDEEAAEKEDNKTREQCLGLLRVLNQVVGQRYLENSSHTLPSASYLRSTEHAKASKVGRRETKPTSTDSQHIDNEYPSPCLRRYILPEAESEIQEEFDRIASNTKTLDQAVEHSRGTVEWRYMCEASKQLLACGYSRRRPRLEKADRSVAWYWNLDSNGNTIDVSAPCPTRGEDPHGTTLQCKPAAQTAKLQQTPAERPIHHLNFAGRPVACKSATPPAVSFWAAFSNNVANHLVNEKYSLRKHVLASQACEYLDPFTVTGLGEIPGLSGTKLQEYVTGYVEKAYHSEGVWQFDELEPDEDKPVHQHDAEYFWHGGLEDCNYPVIPYKISAGEDISINDGGRVDRAVPTVPTLEHRSKLHHVECCEYSPGEPMDQLPSKSIEEQQAGIILIEDPSVKLFDQRRGDISSKENSPLSGGTTTVGDGVKDGPGLPKSDALVEEVNKRLAHESVSIAKISRPESPLSPQSMSSDEEGCYDYTDQSSPSSPVAVDRSCSPSSVKDDVHYTGFCLLLDDIDALIEAVEESDYEELSSCNPWHYGADHKEWKTQDGASFTDAFDFNTTISFSVDKKATPELTEELANGELADAPEGRAAEEKEMTEDVQKDLDELSSCCFLDHGTDHGKPETYAEGSLAVVYDIRPAIPQAVVEELVPELVKALVNVGVVDALANGVMVEADFGLVEASEHVTQEVAPSKASTTVVAEDTVAKDSSEEAELERVEESAEGDVDAAVGNKPVEEKESGVVGACEDHVREVALEKDLAALAFVEDAVNIEIAEVSKVKSQEETNFRVMQASVEGIQDDAPRETPTARDIADPPENNVAEEKTFGVVETPEAPTQRGAPETARTVPELIQESAECEVRNSPGNEVVEKGDSGREATSEGAIHGDNPEESNTTLYAVGAEDGSQDKEDKKQNCTETSTSDGGGLSGTFSGTFSVPRLSNCLLYGSIAAYVGFTVYHALRR